MVIRVIGFRIGYQAWPWQIVSEVGFRIKHIPSLMDSLESVWKEIDIFELVWKENWHLWNRSERKSTSLGNRYLFVIWYLIVRLLRIMAAKCQATKWGRSAAKAQTPGDAADGVLALQGVASPAKRNRQSQSLTMQSDSTNLPAGLGKPGNDPNQVLLTYLLIH